MLLECCTHNGSNLESSAVATRLEKVSFHSNPKETQLQRMLKLPHNCTQHYIPPQMAYHLFFCFFVLFILEGLLVSLLFSGTLHSAGCTFPFLLCLFASLLFSAICKASSDNHFAFLHFLFLGMVWVTTSYTM